MIDAKNPALDAQELMRRVREELERAGAAPAGGLPPMPPGVRVAQRILEARERAVVGVALPPMTGTSGLKRLVAQPLARAFLRLAQLITRDQRTFNDAVVDALQALADEQAALRARLDALAPR